MRILFLTQFWQPEQFFKGLPFAREFANKGYDVQVLTGFPNYPTGKIFIPYRLKLFHRELMDGIKVNRVFLYPSHDQSTIKRIVTYLTFAVSTMILGPFLVKKADIVYVYNLVTLWPFAAFMKYAYGAKIVYDIQDIWPESILFSGMMKPSRLFHWLDKFCKRIYSRADKIAVLSPGFKKYLEDRAIPVDKIEVIYNWVEECICPPKMTIWPDDRKEKHLHILYAGALGTVQGLETVVECATICKEKQIPVSFRLVGFGTCSEKLRQLIQEKELENCEVLPGRPQKDMGELFAWADVFLVHLKDVPLFRITIPSKVQTYLFLGKPVLMAMKGDAATLIEDAKAGFVCSPDNPLEMAEAVARFTKLSMAELLVLGGNGRSFYERKLGQARGVAAFESLFLSLK